MPGTQPLLRVRNACPLPLPWRGSALSSCISRMREILENRQAEGPSGEPGYLAEASPQGNSSFARELTRFAARHRAQPGDGIGVVPFSRTGRFRLLPPLAIDQNAQRQADNAERRQKGMIRIEIDAQRSGAMRFQKSRRVGPILTSLADRNNGQAWHVMLKLRQCWKLAHTWRAPRGPQ